VELDREHGLTLRWPDGFEARFGLEELRLNCPCAECRDRREQGTPVWSPAAPRPLRAVDAELVGAWGLLIRWNDGHETGIFSWGVLRNWR
jgi:ATP-binding protein involved in chromosome partitioning